MADGGFVGIDVIGLEELRAKLRTLRPEAADAGVENANKYLLDYERTAQPPYSYVSFKQAYGGFFSERQRRFVMANIADGGIVVPYRRTQDLRKGWQLLGTGTNQLLVNEVPAAAFTKDEATQARMMKMRGWTTVQQDVRDRMAEIVRRFEAGAQKAMRKLGLD